MKLIIDIPELDYECAKQRWMRGNDAHKMDYYISKGTPLDDIKAEIEQNAYPIVHGVNNHEKGMTLYGILQVLDNIGKGDSEC